MITFLKKGMQTTVQDLGRAGFQRYGMPSCGAMDTFAARLANVLVGNAENEGVLECTVMGPTVRFETANCFAVTGGDLGASLNGEPVPMNRALFADAGDVLELPMAVSGARAYVAFAGGFDLPLVMGSYSTCLKAHIGGVEGRAVKEGDTIAFRAPRTDLPNFEKRVAPENILPRYSAAPTVHFTFGPQDDMFSAAGKQTFIHGRYTVDAKSDRMGFRFNGPEIEAAPGSNGNIVSDGICFGAIQVPSGQPIVMMADRQTTGGYAKIGCVIAADLPLLAQLKAGDSVRFQPVSVPGAQQLLVRQSKALEKLAKALDSVRPEARQFRFTVNGKTFTVTMTEKE